MTNRKATKEKIKNKRADGLWMCAMCSHTIEINRGEEIVAHFRTHFEAALAAVASR